MSERVISDPTVAGWELNPDTGYWMWAAGSGSGSGGGGSIQDGDTEGQITTWDGTEWTPDSAVTVDSSGFVKANSFATNSNNFGSISLFGDTVNQQGVYVGLNGGGDLDINNRDGGEFHYLQNNVRKFTIDATGNAKFSGHLLSATIANANNGCGIRLGVVDGKKMLRPYDFLAGAVTDDIDIGSGNNPWRAVYARSFTVTESTGTNSWKKQIELKNDGDAKFNGVVDAAGIRSGAHSVYESMDLYNSGVPTDVLTVQMFNGNALIQSQQSQSGDARGLNFMTGQSSRMTIDGDGRVDITGSLYVNGTPKIGTSELIETLHTLRAATQDETTLEGLRDSIGNAIGGLIEKFEAMQTASTQEISDE